MNIRSKVIDVASMIMGLPGERPGSIIAIPSQQLTTDLLIRTQRRWHPRPNIHLGTADSNGIRMISSTTRVNPIILPCLSREN